MFSKVLPPLFKWGGIVLSVYFGKTIVADIAGKTTVFNAAVALNSGDSKTQIPIPAQPLHVLFGAAVFVLIAVIIMQWVYIRRANKLHHDSLEHGRNHIKQLEKAIDPKRSTSKKPKIQKEPS